jgi:hypothetical protein
MTMVIDDRPRKGHRIGSAPSQSRYREMRHPPLPRSARFCGGAELMRRDDPPEPTVEERFLDWQWFARHETEAYRPWNHKWKRPIDRFDGPTIESERAFVRRVWGSVMAELPDATIPSPGPVDVVAGSRMLTVTFPFIKRPIPLRMMLSPQQVRILNEPWEPFPDRTAAMGFRVGNRMFVNETETSQVRFEFWIRPASWMIQPGWEEVVACFVCPTPCHHQDMLRADVEIATDMLDALEATRRGDEDAQMGAIRWWMAGQP